MKCHIMQHFIRVYSVCKGKKSSDKIIQYFLKTITRHPWICTIDYPKFIISNKNEETMSIQRINRPVTWGSHISVWTWVGPMLSWNTTSFYQMSWRRRCFQKLLLVWNFSCTNQNSHYCQGDGYFWLYCCIVPILALQGRMLSENLFPSYLIPH